MLSLGCGAQEGGNCSLQAPASCVPRNPLQRLFHGCSIAPYAANIGIVLSHRQAPHANPKPLGSPAQGSNLCAMKHICLSWAHTTREQLGASSVALQGLTRANRFWAASAVLD